MEKPTTIRFEPETKKVLRQLKANHLISHKGLVESLTLLELLDQGEILGLTENDYIELKKALTRILTKEKAVKPVLELLNKL